MIKAAVFDDDGIVVDTDPIASRSYENLLRIYNKTPIYNSHGLVHTSGMRTKDVMKIIKEQYQIEETIEELIAKRAEFYTDLLKDLKAQPGLIPLLNLLKKHKILLAVATSGILHTTKIKLEAARTSHYFDVQVTSEDVNQGKPAPDVYLKAAEQLKITPTECVVFEDAEIGIMAAKSAGMKVIAVPTKYTKSHDLSGADKVIDSLEEVTWEMISHLG